MSHDLNPLRQSSALPVMTPINHKEWTLNTQTSSATKEIILDGVTYVVTIEAKTDRAKQALGGLIDRVKISTDAPFEEVISSTFKKDSDVSEVMLSFNTSQRRVDMQTKYFKNKSPVVRPINFTLSGDIDVARQDSQHPALYQQAKAISNLFQTVYPDAFKKAEPLPNPFDALVRDTALHSSRRRGSTFSHTEVPSAQTQSQQPRRENFELPRRTSSEEVGQQPQQAMGSQQAQPPGNTIPTQQQPEQGGSQPYQPQYSSDSFEEIVDAEAQDVLWGALPDQELADFGQVDEQEDLIEERAGIPDQDEAAPRPQQAGHTELKPANQQPEQATVALPVAHEDLPGDQPIQRERAREEVPERDQQHQGEQPVPVDDFVATITVLPTVNSPGEQLPQTILVKPELQPQKPEKQPAANQIEQAATLPLVDPRLPPPLPSTLPPPLPKLTDTQQEPFQPQPVTQQPVNVEIEIAQHSDDEQTVEVLLPNEFSDFGIDHSKDDAPDADVQGDKKNSPKGSDSEGGDEISIASSPASIANPVYGIVDLEQNLEESGNPEPTSDLPDQSSLLSQVDASPLVVPNPHDSEVNPEQLDAQDLNAQPTSPKSLRIASPALSALQIGGDDNEEDEDKTIKSPSSGSDSGSDSDSDSPKHNKSESPKAPRAEQTSPDGSEWDFQNPGDLESPKKEQAQVGAPTDPLPAQADQVLSAQGQAQPLTPKSDGSKVSPKSSAQIQDLATQDSDKERRQGSDTDDNLEVPDEKDSDAKATGPKSPRENVLSSPTHKKVPKALVSDDDESDDEADTVESPKNSKAVQDSDSDVDEDEDEHRESTNPILEKVKDGAASDMMDMFGGAFVPTGIAELVPDSASYSKTKSKDQDATDQPDMFGAGVPAETAQQATSLAFSSKANKKDQSTDEAILESPEIGTEVTDEAIMHAIKQQLKKGPEHPAIKNENSKPKKERVRFAPEKEIHIIEKIPKPKSVLPKEKVTADTPEEDKHQYMDIAEDWVGAPKELDIWKKYDVIMEDVIDPLDPRIIDMMENDKMTLEDATKELERKQKLYMDEINKQDLAGRKLAMRLEAEGEADLKIEKSLEVHKELSPLESVTKRAQNANESLEEILKGDKQGIDKAIENYIEILNDLNKLLHDEDVSVLKNVGVLYLEIITIWTELLKADATKTPASKIYQSIITGLENLIKQGKPPKLVDATLNIYKKIRSNLNLVDTYYISKKKIKNPAEFLMKKMSYKG